MTTTVTLRKLLDRKQWELLNSYPGANVTALSAASTQFDQLQLWMDSATSSYLYSPLEDSFVQLSPSGVASFTSSASGIVYHPSGPTGTASAGGASTITTTLTLPSSLAGYTIRITGGAGAGQERVIASNTYGTNSVITVSSTWGTNPDNTSTYLILSGRFWVLGNTVGSTSGMVYYDVALNTWTTRTTVSITAMTFGNMFVATPAFGNTIASGTATSGSATTLVNSGKAWATNQWTNYQLRIVSGTGAGQVRVISSNTGTTLTIPTGATLDNTSVYVIEPDDNALYTSTGILTYKYSISANTWSTLSPGAARTTTTNVGSSYNWVGIASDASWADETNIKNGRYIYSFAGGGAASVANNLAVYDIAANTWINTQLAYGHSGGASLVGVGAFMPAGGYSYVADREFIYIMAYTQFNAPPFSFFRFNTVTNSLDPWAQWTLGVASSGGPGRLSVATYTDGGTTIRWLYCLHPTTASPAPLYRCLVI